MRAWLELGKKQNSKGVNEDDEFVRVPYDIIAIPDVELNYWLAKFVVEVRKRENGEAYCGILCIKWCVVYSGSLEKMDAQN